MSDSNNTTEIIVNDNRFSELELKVGHMDDRLGNIESIQREQHQAVISIDKTLIRVSEHIAQHNKFLEYILPKLETMITEDKVEKIHNETIHRLDKVECRVAANEKIIWRFVGGCGAIAGVLSILKMIGVL